MTAGTGDGGREGRTCGNCGNNDKNLSECDSCFNSPGTYVGWTPKSQPRGAPLCPKCGNAVEHVRELERELGRVRGVLEDGGLVNGMINNVHAPYRGHWQDAINAYRDAVRERIKENQCK